MRNLFIAGIKSALRGLFRVLFRVRLEGQPPNPLPPKLLIVANHESFLDGLLLGLFLPMKPVFVVHTWVARQPFFHLLLSLADYLAVDPAHPLAIKKIIKLVESGRPVVIFPEGRITVTGSLMKVYDGPAFVAAKTGAAILPVRLDGPARSYFSRLTGQMRKQFFPEVTLSIQPLTHLAMVEEGSARERRRKAGEGLREIMRAMLFNSQPRMGLLDAFCEAAALNGWRREIVEDANQTPYTYRQVLKMALAAGTYLRRNSMDGENVGILLPNLAITAAAVLGASAFKRTPAMLNHTAGADGLQNACKAAGISTALTSRVFVEKAKLAETLGKLENIRWIYLEDLRDFLSAGDKLWIALASRLPRFFVRPVDPESAAVVLFTSGSEGAPKGVVLSHRALTSNVAQVRSVIDMNSQDKVFNALPMFHSFGLTGGTLLPLLTGMPVFLYVSPLHYRVIPEIIYDRNCTVLFGTSTFLGNYAKYAHPYDFFKLRYVVAGAEKLSDAVRDAWFDKFGIRILEGYGATETSPVLAVNTPMAFRRGTVGVLLPGVRAQLIPVSGISDGRQLHVSGPNLMSGYLKVDQPGVLQPPASEVGPGWYDTGDIVSIDADGFVAIRGRVKRFAKIAGEMVSLEVVEKLAHAVSPAAVHAVTTRADASKGEALVLYTTDRGLTREALQGAAQASGIPELAVPRKINMVDALPLLGTGKTDYVTLKKMAEAA